MYHEKMLPALYCAYFKSRVPNIDIDAMENSTRSYEAIGLRDITPTVLKIMGNEKTISMTGRPVISPLPEE